MSDPVAFCSSARLYLKPSLPDDGSPTLDLSGDDEPILQPFGCGLLETYVVDEGSRFSYVHRHHLRAAGMSEQDLRAISIQNLSSFTEGRLKIHRAGPYWALILDGNFEASLLALDWLWDNALQDYARTSPVVAVPSRDVVAFCDIGSLEGIAELEQVIARVGDTDHPISSKLLWRTAGRWANLDHT